MRGTPVTEVTKSAVAKLGLMSANGGTGCFPRGDSRHFQKTASIVGMEACLSAHFICRALRQLGHEPRISPAIYVKPFVNGQKKKISTMPKPLLKPRCGRTCAPCARRHRINSSSGLPSRSLPPGLAADCHDQSDPSLRYRATHRSQDRIVGSAQLFLGNFKEPPERDIATDGRPDRWPLRRLDMPR
jgi:hypothetical protein